jgi:cellulose 1,4-beta-cellobiosidase
MDITVRRIVATTMLIGTVVAVGPTTAAQAASSAVNGPAPNLDGRGGGTVRSAAGTAPAVIAAPAVVTIPEGHTGSFTVRLNQPPTQVVPLGMALSGTGLWGAPPILLVFTPTNWNTPQSFSVFSLQDSDTLDDILNVTLTATGYASALVILQQIDDD